MSDHCEEALARMYEFLDGELADAEMAARIRFHLEDCPPCGDSFHFEHHLQAVVRERLREEVPPAMIERLRVVIRSENLLDG